MLATCHEKLHPGELAVRSLPKQIPITASCVANNRVVFNIGGIKYRLIVKVEYHFKTIYIRPPAP